MLGDILAAGIKSFVIVNLLLVSFAYMTLLERKTMGRIQQRLGPNRVGPMGLLQPIADGLKLALKEDIIPAQANRWVHLAAPVMALVPALIIFAVVPVGPPLHLGDYTINLWITDVNVAYLYVTAIASLGVYGLVLGGWASNNKYSLLGGLRASAQMISYELPQGLAVLTVIVLAGTLSLRQIVEQQFPLPFAFGGPLSLSPSWLGLLLFVPVGLIAFMVYLVAGVAETNRAPFDLPEAEGELGAGFHTEYSGFKWSMFFMAEYVNIVNVSAIASVLFLGGWWPGMPAPLPPALGAFWFLLKVTFFVFLYIWLRATLPRLRYDRLMNLGWKFLLPVALINLMVASVLVVVWPS